MVNKERGVEMVNLLNNDGLNPLIIACYKGNLVFHVYRSENGENFTEVWRRHEYPKYTRIIPYSCGSIGRPSDNYQMVLGLKSRYKH